MLGSCSLHASVWQASFLPSLLLRAACRCGLPERLSRPVVETEGSSRQGFHPEWHCVLRQAAGLVPIVEPEVLLDGEHDIDRTLEVAEATWAETFKYLADNKVLFEGILLKPSMVTPGAENPNRSTPEQVADYTLKLLTRRVPPAVPGASLSC